MNRIAITGSQNTEKTIVSRILSHLTGFVHLQPRSDYETEALKNQFRLNHNQFYTGYIVCLSKLSDRLINESSAGNCFISNGCLLTEVASLKALHELSNSGKKQFNQQSLMIQSVENAAIHYFRNRYDQIILLSPVKGLSAGLSQFSEVYNHHLKKMLDNCGQRYNHYEFADLEQTIRQIIGNADFTLRMSIEEAIYKTRLDLYQ
ncbi:MAG: hypothetical protein A2066_04475 [Bacteroidetes bacterium GWB2_41_8]|nr:MAG: hypothetical protein A2066_04475 [Bacteroidetes bacterium GWB2_41_8]